MSGISTYMKDKHDKWGIEVERRLKLYGNTCFYKHKPEILEYLDSKGIKYNCYWYYYSDLEDGFGNKRRSRGKSPDSGNWYIELIE